MDILYLRVNIKDKVNINIDIIIHRIFYSDKFAKIGWQINEFYQDDDVLKEKIARIAAIKDALLVNLYNTDPLDQAGILNWIKSVR